jgi:hypothetical protein
MLEQVQPPNSLAAHDERGMVPAEIGETVLRSLGRRAAARRRRAGVVNDATRDARRELSNVAAISGSVSHASSPSGLRKIRRAWPAVLPQQHPAKIAQGRGSS